MIPLHPSLARVLSAHGSFFTHEADDTGLGVAKRERLLAARFAYHVRQGGFAQLLYSSRGLFLREIEDMLVALGATRAQDHYVRAVRLASADPERWRRFRASDFVSEKDLRPLLDAVSLDHLARGPSFEEEIAPALARWSRETPPRA